jgi:CPA2 family monovalent cation:H+ antiporter-2
LGEPLLVESLIVIAASVAAVAMLGRIGAPPILGYLAAGLAIGPHGLHLISPGEETQFLAELGVIFLMFTVGLEFSLPAMLAGRGDVFVAGALQVGLTTAVGVGLATLFGADPTAALLMGGAVAMSSTAVVLKQLSDQGELGSPAGRRTAGLLVFQDLATLPFLVTVGAYAGAAAAGPISQVRQVALGGVTLVAAALVGRPLFRGALTWVAQSRSAELLLMAVLLMALGAAWMAGLAGLAAPLGAFMAGVLVGESDIRHHAEDQVRPFRDVLMGLFFVTIGMGLDLRGVAARPLATAAWLATILLAKPAIVLLVARLRRWPGEDGLRTALALANGGEFGLLLLTQAQGAGLAPAAQTGPAILALVASMGIAPLVMPLWSRLARWAPGLSPSRAPADVAASTQHLSDHVILCGCGRIGRLVAAAIEASGLPYVALERDFTHFREARKQGLRVLFADASRLGVLSAAGLDRSRLMVLTFDAGNEAGRILRWAKDSAVSAHRLASAQDEASAAALIAQGAEVVFPENLAAGLGLANQALLLCGLDQQTTARIVTELRGRTNPELGGAIGL